MSKLLLQIAPKLVLTKVIVDIHFDFAWQVFFVEVFTIFIPPRYVECIVSMNLLETAIRKTIVTSIESIAREWNLSQRVLLSWEFGSTQRNGVVHSSTV
jgi:hypothetical protein